MLDNNVTLGILPVGHDLSTYWGRCLGGIWCEGTSHLLNIVSDVLEQKDMDRNNMTTGRQMSVVITII